MKRLLGIVLTEVVLSLQLWAQTNSITVKLAIVSESPNTVAAADVLTAEFSKNEEVQLLERTEIEKVIHEQQLSLDNLDCLKLGRLLGADGLLALQSSKEGTNPILNLQMVAVKPGVILSDEQFGLPSRDASGWAQNIANRLGPLLPKLNILPQNAIPISVVNFHAGLRTTDEAEMEQQIYFLTIERLVQERRLFVLERKRMQSLSEEKELAGNAAEPFWSGKYLLEGAIDRDGYSSDAVTINARLIPPGGNPILIEVSSPRTNCIEAVNQLADKVLAALKINSQPAAWNPAAEADRFYQEAKWNLAWQIFPQARQAAEAAWALGKHDADCMNLRVRTFMPPPDSGLIYYPPRQKPNPEKIDDAIQAAELYQEFSRNLPPDEPKPGSDWYKLGLENLTIATRVLQQFNWSLEFYEPVADKLAELRAQARAMAELLSRAPSVRDSYFVGSRKVKYDDLYHFEEQPSIYGLEVEGGCLWQETPEDTLALYRKLMTSPVFRYLHERLWFRGRYSTGMNPMLPQKPDRLVAWNEADQKRIPQIWNNFLNELLNSPDIFCQMEARALQLADTDHLSEMLSMAGNHDAYKLAYKNYEKELSSAFTDFFDAFITNRIYFKTNNVDVLCLNWGVDDLVGRMGGSIVTDAKGLLQKQYRTEYAARLAAIDKELGSQLAARDEALRAENAKAEKFQAFEKQKTFLKGAQPFDPQTFVPMFTFGFKDYSREQAQEIKPLLAEYKKQLSGKWAEIGQIQVGEIEANIEHILNPAAVAPHSPNRAMMTNGNPARPLSGNFPSGRPPWFGQLGSPPPFAQHRSPPDRETKPLAEAPALEAITSSNVITVREFYPLPLNHIPGDKIHEFKFMDHRMIEGKLLMNFSYNAWIYSFDKNGNWQSSADKRFIGTALFDPNSKHWEVAVLPKAFSEPVNLLPLQSVLWRGDLYSSYTGKIQKYNFHKQVWEPAGFAIDGGWQFFNLHGRLFITDPNSIQEVNENGRSTKLLASIQRQPAITILDSQGALRNLALFTDAHNFVCAAVHNKVFRWDGTDWREIGAASTSFQPSIFESGVLFLTDGWNTRPARISCFDTRSNMVETCLVPPAQQPTQRESWPRSPTGTILVKPLWKLPAELSLPNLSAAYWQSDLFLMADHSEKQDILAEERGMRPDGTLEVSHVIAGEKFLPKDEYNSILFCFSRKWAATEKVLLKFDNSKGCPPMAGLGSNSKPLIPQIGVTRGWMVFTEKFLLCGRERLGNGPGSSEPAGFKPGIWVASLSQIKTEITQQNNLQEERLTKADAEAKQAAKALQEKIDLNHDGIIDETETENALMNKEFILSKLEVIDSNHNDRLDAEELKFFDANHNKKLEPNELAGINLFQHLRAEQLLKKYDANGDGVLDRMEYDELEPSQSSMPIRFAPNFSHRPPGGIRGDEMDQTKLEDFLQQKTDSGIRAGGTANAMMLQQLRMDPSQPIDRQQIFKAAIEFYWQNHPDAPHAAASMRTPPCISD